MNDCCLTIQNTILLNRKITRAPHLKELAIDEKVNRTEARMNPVAENDFLNSHKKNAPGDLLQPSSPEASIRYRGDSVPPYISTFRFLLNT